MTRLSRKFLQRQKKQRKKLRRKISKVKETRISVLPKPKPVKKPKIKKEEYARITAKLKLLYNDLKKRNQYLQNLREKIKKTTDEKLRTKLKRKYSEEYKKYMSKKREFDKLIKEKNKYIQKITRSIIYVTRPTKEQIERRKERHLEIILTLKADKNIVTQRNLEDLIWLFIHNNLRLEDLKWDEGKKKPLGLTEWMSEWSKDKTIEIELNYIDHDYPHNSKNFYDTAFTLQELRHKIGSMSLI